MTDKPRFTMDELKYAADHLNKATNQILDAQKEAVNPTIFKDSEVHDGPGYHSINLPKDHPLNQPHSDVLDVHWNTATGVQIRGDWTKPHPTFSCLLDWQWTLVPWWVRLLGLVRLPYDVIKFVVTGRFIFIPWPWRW